jgi:TonB-dependent receptor-like protein
MRQSKLCILLVAATITGACASNPAASSPSSGQSATRTRSEVITAEELAKVDAPNAYLAVQRLRPQYLQTRGQTTIMGQSSIQVYVDGTRMGGVEALQQIPTTDIKEIRWLSSSEATQRFGTGNAQGAIVVTRK